MRTEDDGMKRTTLEADPDVRDYLALTKARTGQSAKQTLNDGARLHALLRDPSKLQAVFPDYDDLVQKICELAGIRMPS